MSKKGFKVLEALINNNYQSAISAVIVGRDNNIDYDFANEINQPKRQDAEARYLSQYFFQNIIFPKYCLSSLSNHFFI